MEDGESDYCPSWHCFCKTLLSKRPKTIKVTTPFSLQLKRKQEITLAKVVKEKESKSKKEKARDGESSDDRTSPDDLNKLFEITNQQPLISNKTLSPFPLKNSSTSKDYSDDEETKVSTLTKSRVVEASDKKGRFCRRFLSPNKAEPKRSPKLSPTPECSVPDVGKANRLDSTLESENLNLDATETDNGSEHTVAEVKDRKLFEEPLSDPSLSESADISGLTSAVVTDPSQTSNGVTLEESNSDENQPSDNQDINSEPIAVETKKEEDLGTSKIEVVENEITKPNGGTDVQVSETNNTVTPAKPTEVRRSSSTYNCRNRSQFHKCGNCGKMFGQLSSLKWHEKEHLLESSKLCECVECGKSYTTLATYQRHLKSHTKCILCGKGISKAQKEREGLIAGTKGLNVNVCVKCKKVDLNSPRKIKLKGHVFGNGTPVTGYDDDEESMSETDDVMANDDDIDSSSANLTPQIVEKKTGEEMETAFPCRYCGKCFPTSALMKNHEGIIHNSERRFKCNYCPARFKENHHRSRHEVTHTYNRPHSCKLCGVSFNQRFRLKSHLHKFHAKK